MKINEKISIQKNSKRGRPKTDKNSKVITNNEDLQKKSYSGKKRGRKPKRLLENIEYSENDEEEKGKLFQEIIKNLLSWEKVTNSNLIQKKNLVSNENFNPKKIRTKNSNETIEIEKNKETEKMLYKNQLKIETNFKKNIDEDKILEEKNVSPKDDNIKNKNIENKQIYDTEQINSPNTTPNSATSTSSGKYKIPKKKITPTTTTPPVTISKEESNKFSPKEQLINYCKQNFNCIPIFKQTKVSTDGIWVSVTLPHLNDYEIHNKSPFKNLNLAEFQVSTKALEHLGVFKN
jgi:hypothetical protein